MTQLSISKDFPLISKLAKCPLFVFKIELTLNEQIDLHPVLESFIHFENTLRTHITQF